MSTDSDDIAEPPIVVNFTGTGGRRLTLPMLRALVARTTDWPEDCVVDLRGTAGRLFLQVYRPGFEPAKRSVRGRCGTCRRPIVLTSSGQLRFHKHAGERCSGSGKPPAGKGKPKCP